MGIGGCGLADRSIPVRQVPSASAQDALKRLGEGLD